MKALLITIAVIVAILFLLFIIRINFRFVFDGNQRKITLKIAGIKIRLKKKKSEDKQKDKSKDKQKKIDLSDIRNNFDIVIDSCKTIKKVLRLFFHKLKIEKLHLCVVVSSDDAAQTAKIYGYVSTAIYNLQGIILHNFKVKDIFFDVKADFLKEKTTATGDIHLKISLFDAFVIFLVIIKGAHKIYKRTKREKAV